MFIYLYLFTLVLKSPDGEWPIMYTLHYITLHYVTLRYVTLRYITLHYIVMDLHPTFRSSGNTLCHFMLLKQEISSGRVEHLAWEERSFYPLNCNTFTTVFSRCTSNEGVSRQGAKYEHVDWDSGIRLSSERNPRE